MADVGVLPTHLKQLGTSIELWAGFDTVSAAPTLCTQKGLTIEGPDEHAGLDVPRAAHHASVPRGAGGSGLNTGAGRQEVVATEGQRLRRVSESPDVSAPGSVGGRNWMQRLTYCIKNVCVDPAGHAEHNRAP